MYKGGKYVFLLMLLPGCNIRDKSSLPQDLMYRGRPIHPTHVTGIGFGDSSRLEPKSIECVGNRFNDGCAKEISRELIYDEENNKVSFKLNYVFIHEGEEPQYTCEYMLYDAYQYIGSYKGKHLLIMESYDTSGTGCEACLALVKRIDNTIINAGEITGGDRADGGIIEVISHEKNIVRYQQCATVNTIMRVFKGENWGMFKGEDCSAQFGGASLVSGLSLVCEVDLDAEINTDDYRLRTIPTQIVGLRFDEQDYACDGLSYHDDENLHDQIEKSLYTVANAYVKQGKKELALVQAQNFVNEVFDQLK